MLIFHRKVRQIFSTGILYHRDNHPWRVCKLETLAGAGEEEKGDRSSLRAVMIRFGTGWKSRPPLHMCICLAQRRTTRPDSLRQHISYSNGYNVEHVVIGTKKRRWAVGPIHPKFGNSSQGTCVGLGTIMSGILSRQL